VRAVLAIALLACVAPSLLAQDWPQWRGPRADGVAAILNAPERWSPHEGIVWRAEIEGYGISSPVVAGDRVYVTTALTAPQRTQARIAIDRAVALLAVAGIPGLFAIGWRQRRAYALHGGRTLTAGLLEWMDGAVFALLSLAVLVFGVLVATWPAAMNEGLTLVRDAVVMVARSLGRHQTNLSFVEWNEANRHNTWIISSALALAALALPPFLFRARSLARAAGAALLLSGAALAVTSVPWGAAYGDRYPTGALIVFHAPVVALASWHLLRFVLGRLWAPGERVRAPATAARCACGLPVALAVGLFASPNYLHQQEMVTRRIVCLDAASGARLWQSDVFATPPARASLNSDATPTPAVSGDTIVAAFGPGIAAVDRDGNLRWSRMFPDWIDNSIYGAGSSPVIDGDVVFVTLDREYEGQQPSRVAAYRLGTGEELWISTPTFAHDGYSSPVIADDGYRRLLLTLTSKALAAYDVASGVAVWTLELPVYQPVPSVIVDADRLYVTAGIGASGVTAAYQLRPDAAPRELWRSPHRADVSSPVLYRGQLFAVSTTGVMVCFDAVSGKVLWRQRIGSGPGAFYASLVAVDEKVYAARSNGTTSVIAAGGRFQALAESPLSEEIFASPAVSRDCLLLRTVSALYCVGTAPPARAPGSIAAAATPDRGVP
jgi:outer membrane protein assembly factor BamB